MNIQHPVPGRAPTEDPQAPARGDPATRLGAGRGHSAHGRPGPGARGERGQRSSPPIGASQAGSAGQGPDTGALGLGTPRESGGRPEGQEGDGERTQSPVTTALEATAYRLRAAQPVGSRRFGP